MACTDCKNCVKEDVCNQKDIFNGYKQAVKGIKIAESVGDSICIHDSTVLQLRFGMVAKVECVKGVPKQTDIFTSRSNKFTKNL